MSLGEAKVSQNGIGRRQRPRNMRLVWQPGKNVSVPAVYKMTRKLNSIHMDSLSFFPSFCLVFSLSSLYTHFIGYILNASTEPISCLRQCSHVLNIVRQHMSLCRTAVVHISTQLPTKWQKYKEICVRELPHLHLLFKFLVYLLN